MKSKFVFSLLAAAAVTSASSWARAAAAAAPAGPPALPVLHVDSSPVSDGKAEVVTSYADVVAPVQKAVVSIYLTKTVRVFNPLLRQFFGNVPGVERDEKESGLGSGVIVSPDGYILTNNHVVAGADELTVSLSDDRKFTAKVVGTDEKTDIAIIKIDADHLPTLTLADSDKLRVGDIVFAVGNPLDVGETVTMGIVSAKGRAPGLLDDVGGYEDFIQTDAAINLGNSGGALVDAKGRLVGINSAIVSPSRGNVGIGLAVPINLAASVMQSLIATGTVKRGYLGVDSTQTLTSDIAEQLGLPKGIRGVIIMDVKPGGPADQAGLKSSDVVLAVDGRPVATPGEIRLAIAEKPPGAQIALQVMRNGKPLAITVVLGALDEKPNELLNGVSVEPVTDEIRQKLDIDPRIGGLLITAVDGSSPYADSLAPNMVIVSINQRQIADLASAKKMIKERGRYLLLVYYRGSLSYTTLTRKEE